MKGGFTGMLIVAILFGTGYWYYSAHAVCNVPIAYRIGSVDPRFNITNDEVRSVISVAESLWEDATGRNLFTYSEDADLSVNFIFDDRQKEANIEADLRKELDQKEDINRDVGRQYEYLLEKYGDLKSGYEKRSIDYERRLQEHNAEVERWNGAGGAPEDIYANLADHQKQLKAEQEELNTIAYKLNELVKEMNAIGAEGNSLVAGYNEIVDEYNSRFDADTEFTQGDYQGDAIDIYQFDSKEELVIVLAHEFGHALSIGHVEGEDSIMFHFMGAQSLENGVTVSDVDEFERVCGDTGFTFRSII